MKVVDIARIMMAFTMVNYLIKRTGCGFWPVEKEETEDVEVQKKESEHSEYKKKP